MHYFKNLRPLFLLPLTANHQSVPCFMDISLTLIIASIVLLFLLFLVLFIFRERVEIQVADDMLLLNYPFRKKKVRLEKELVSWELQQAYYLRLGNIYAINMQLESGKQLSVSSRLNQENYERLYQHLQQHYPEKRVTPKR